MKSVKSVLFNLSLLLGAFAVLYISVPVILIFINLILSNFIFLLASPLGYVVFAYLVFLEYLGLKSIFRRAKKTKNKSLVFTDLEELDMIFQNKAPGRRFSVV